MEGTDQIAVDTLYRLEALRAGRGTYERNWQDIRELVRINTTNFQRQTYPGDVRSENIFDGTAPMAMEQLASALHSYMSSPTDRWFSLEVDGDADLNRDPDAVAWCEAVSEAIFAEYRNDRTNTTQSLNECYLDIASFGTAVLWQGWDDDENHILCRAHSLSKTYLEEDKNGRIDVVLREYEMDARQLVQMFPEAVGNEKFDRLTKDAERNKAKFVVVHGIFPRTDRIPGRLDAANKPWASVWVLKPLTMTLRQSGYDQNPYCCPRWQKVPEEAYGRGPAINCLPEIRVLNRMELTILKAAQKATDPPLIVPNDGYMGQIHTSPGSIISKEPGAEEIQVLEHKGRFDIGQEKTDQKREAIRGAFYADFVKFISKKERQSAYEIQQLIDQNLRMMSPMLGRLQAELHGPLVTRTYNLLLSHNRLPPVPVVLNNRKLKIAYISMAAIAQRSARANSNAAFVQELIPAAQVDPSVMDAIDFDAYAQETSFLRGASRRILRSPKAIAAIRQQRQQSQQLQQMAQAAQPAAQAVKNIAEAQNIGAGA